MGRVRLVFFSLLFVYFVYKLWFNFLDFLDYVTLPFIIVGLSFELAELKTLKEKQGGF